MGWRQHSVPRTFRGAVAVRGGGGEGARVGLWPPRVPARGSADPGARWIALLGALPWAIGAVVAPIMVVAFRVTGQVPVIIGIPLMASVFGLLVLRLVLTAVRDSERRFAASSLALALVMWVGGSVQVNSSTQAASVPSFPAAGEWLFLASFLALASSLVVDVAARVRPSLADWLDAAVASGGAISVVALLVVTPLADDFNRQGGPPLVGPIYPAMDALLLVLLVPQGGLRKRA